MSLKYEIQETEKKRKKYKTQKYNTKQLFKIEKQVHIPTSP